MLLADKTLKPEKEKKGISLTGKMVNFDFALTRAEKDLVYGALTAIGIFGRTDSLPYQLFYTSRDEAPCPRQEAR